MKTNNLSILVLLAGSLLSSAAWSERGHRMSAEERVERMTERLALSTEQQVALVELMEATQAEREAARAEGAEFDREAGRDAFEADLQEILTAEQLAQFQERPRGRRDRNDSTDRPARN